MSPRQLFRPILIAAPVAALLFFQNCDKPVQLDPRDTTATTSPSSSQTKTCADISEDPYYCQVVLLMHFDGANGSSNFVDSSPNPHPLATIVTGTPVLNSNQSMFGGSSLCLDGESLISLPNSADWNLSTSDLTIEAWVYANKSLDTGIVGQSPVTQDENWWFGLYKSNPIAQDNGGNNNFIGSLTVPQSTWTHVAVTRQGTTTRLFVNGLLAGSSTLNPFNQSSNPLYIGGNNITSSGTVNLFFGCIDELRITKGVARYTAPFTVPTAAFPSL